MISGIEDREGCASPEENQAGAKLFGLWLCTVKGIATVDE
jgi:hypothetical protein